MQIARRLAAVGAEQHYYARAERKVDRYLLVQLQAAAVEDSTRGVDNERIIAIEQRGYRSDKAAYKAEAPCCNNRYCDVDSHLPYRLITCIVEFSRHIELLEHRRLGAGQCCDGGEQQQRDGIVVYRGICNSARIKPDHRHEKSCENGVCGK